MGWPVGAPNSARYGQVGGFQVAKPTEHPQGTHDYDQDVLLSFVLVTSPLENLTKTCIFHSIFKRSSHLQIRVPELAAGPILGGCLRTSHSPASLQGPRPWHLWGPELLSWVLRGLHSALSNVTCSDPTPTHLHTPSLIPHKPSEPRASRWANAEVNRQDS